MKKIIFITIAFIGFCLAVTVQAQNPMLSPGDAIIGGQSDGVNFNQGVAGGIANTNTWPSAEDPPNAIDGGAGKYLNFGITNTGFIVSPSGAAAESCVGSMQIWINNGLQSRDPASYELYGTDGPITIPLAMSSLTLISSGPLNLPPGRNVNSLNAANSETIQIGSTVPYMHYVIVFPTVVGPNANSMSIGEVQFFSGECLSPTTNIPTLSEWGLITLALLMMIYSSIALGFKSISFAGTGGSNIPLPGGRMFFLPFNKGVFDKSLLFTATLALIGFTICFAIYRAVFMPDIIGVAIAGPLFAYLMHLLIMSEKNRKH